MFTRRSFLKSAGAAGIAAASFNEKGIESAIAATRFVGGRTPEEVATDEDFWFQVQQAFTVDRTLINLNNGGVSPSPRIVQEAMRRYLEYSNQAPVYTMWRILEPQKEGVRKRLAAVFGCDPEEMAITRNASEALEICQLGLTLKPGDEVLTTEQDYPRMLTTWRQRERRDGIVVRKIPFPNPPESLDQLASLFERAITPKTRVIHFCHITNLTGQIFPVSRICRMARERGIEAIVDGAHAFAHFPYKHAELDCDYYGTSLHKWLLAPFGTGFLFVRKNRIKDLWPLMAAEEKQDNDIRKFEAIGTHPEANFLAIGEALTFHEGIGAERKAARLRFLFHRWAKRLDGMKGVKILTSYDPQQSCGLANISIEGVDVAKLVEYLFNSHRIIVTPIIHPAVNGLRVTPNVYTTLREVDTFAEVMEQVIQKGLPA
ncbi:MAG TPA: aminotransferase class V-fold PLP-dependent enzyme [Blastocatellia bacterium]|nr:aminotransferase class V-fold PLP-dependent enzyme [Blastocatellia bacterium]